MALPDGNYMIDTSIVVRLHEPTSPARLAVVNALHELTTAQQPLYVAPQVMYEFWAVVTRPSTARGGLGMTPTQAATHSRILRNQFRVLPETPALYPAWERLAEVAQVSGKNVHDTRLVAFMIVHKLTHLLTLNGDDFRRFEPITGITVVVPAVPETVPANEIH